MLFKKSTQQLALLIWHLAIVRTWLAGQVILRINKRGFLRNFSLKAYYYYTQRRSARYPVLTNSDILVINKVLCFCHVYNLQCKVSACFVLNVK